MEIRAGESLWVRPSGDKGRGYVLWGNKGCHVHVLTVREEVVTLRRVYTSTRSLIWITIHMGEVV